MHPLKWRPILPWLVGITVIGLIASQARIYPHTRILGIRVPGGCEIDFYMPPAQPEFVIAQACPREDMKRWWPWPVTQPWFEESGEETAMPEEARGRGQ